MLQMLLKPMSQPTSMLSTYKNQGQINEKVAKLGGDGGVIGIDKSGNIAMEMNTNGMYRAYMNSKGDVVVKIYNDE